MNIYQVKIKIIPILLLIIISACSSKIEDCKYTTGKIVKGRYYKKQYYYYDYYVGGKKYTRQESCYLSSIKTGETYRVCYEAENPEKARLVFREPIVLDSSKYQNVTGTIDKVDERKVLFRYNINGKDYERGQYINVAAWKEGDACNVFYNRDKPSIAYLNE